MKNKQNILIAEDDAFLAKIIGNHLKNDGYNVHVVENGEEAIQRIAKNDYSLILLDLIMPVKDGFEVMKDMQKMEKETPPVLVFSNLSQEEDKEEAERLGATDFYVKANISVEDLTKIVKKYIREENLVKK